MHDDNAALQSHQRELAIRIKLFGEEHSETADSYRQVKITQDALRKLRKVKTKEKQRENCKNVNRSFLKLSDPSCLKE